MEELIKKAKQGDAETQYLLELILYKTMDESEALHEIVRLSISKKIPVMIFVSDSSVSMTNKLISYITGFERERFIKASFNEEEWKHIDIKLMELYEAPLWVNDIAINSLEDYKSVEKDIKRENIKFIFIDSLPDTIDKKEVIKWGQEIEVSICFTKFHFI